MLALDEASRATLLDAAGDDEVIEALQEHVDPPLECPLDKAWDGIQRCLTDGTLADDRFPLGAAVLGGLPLHEGDSYIVSYNTADEVREIAVALAALDVADVEARFWSLDPDDYDGSIDAEDLEYVLAYLQDLMAFYQKAAHHGWASVFFADQ